MTSDANLQLLLHVSAAIAVIVVAAQLFGRLARRIGQPAVVGEMVSGLLLGPTLLGAVAPSFSGYAFSTATKPILYSLSMVGLTLYMFLVGLQHSHPRSSRRETLLPFVLGIGGMVGPLLVGAVAALVLVPGFRPADVPVPVYALFLGGALAVTAFPMLARVLQERNMVHTRFGRVAASAAAVDDALAWVVLAIVGALAGAGSVAGSLRTIVPAAVLVALLFAVLPRIFRRPMERAVDIGSLPDALLVGLLGVLLAVGWCADFIGIYSVFGGFISGVALPKVPGFAALINGSLLQFVRLFFLPLFFAFSGLNTDLRPMLQLDFLLPLAGLLVVAILAKSASSYLVLRGIFSWDRRRAGAMGALMNARGLMILIFINAGLGMGVVSRPVFSMLVVVAVVTTGLSVPVYRRCLTRELEQQERREASTQPAQIQSLPEIAGKRADPAQGRFRTGEEVLR